MSDLRDLYQEVIFDHNRHPRNFGALARHNRSAVGHNPLCGDRLTLYLEIANDVIRDVSFDGSGCAISTASGSLLTEAVKGRSVAEAEALFKAFHAMLTGADEAHDTDLGKLEVFSGVREFPARVKCATLAWHTLHSALARDNQTVSTE